MAGDGPSASNVRGPDAAAALARRRIEEYAARWERSSAKLNHGDYHADDFVEDCFAMWGNAIRDATAVAALAWQAGARPRAPRAAPPSATR